MRGPRLLALSGTFAARRDKLLGQDFDPHRFLKTTVSLDSATLSDASVVGPDKVGIVDREFRKGLVENSLLRKLLDQSISDADLAKLLAEEIKRWEQSLREFGRSGAAEGLKSMIDKKAAVPALHKVVE